MLLIPKINVIKGRLSLGRLADPRFTRIFRVQDRSACAHDPRALFIDDIDVDQLLAAFSLERRDLNNPGKVTNAVRGVAARMPAYITLKDVKKRWGKGQEDIFPVAQFEKLWGDMTALADLNCHFVAVPRERGQQIKEPAQLDGWLRDGSAAYVDALCAWQ